MRGMQRGFLVGIVVGLLVGAAGAWAFLHESTATVAPREVSRPDRTRASDTSSPSLVGSADETAAMADRLRKAKARIRQLTEELDAAQRPPPTAPAKAPPHKPEEMPPAAREQAARLGVSDAALDALWKVRARFYRADAATEARLLAEVRPFEAEMIRAAAALQLGGAGHVSVPEVVAALHVPGGAEEVIRMIEDEGVTPLLRALSGYDSPEVRDYLVERIAREVDPMAFWYEAQALGDLQEERGPEAIHLQALLGPRWSGVRGRILDEVGRMGGPKAVSLLETYLRTPNVDAIGAALTSLWKLDPDAARAYAREIRDGERYAFLDVIDRSVVSRLAGED